MLAPRGKDLQYLQAAPLRRWRAVLDGQIGERSTSHGRVAAVMTTPGA